MLAVSAGLAVLTASFLASAPVRSADASPCRARITYCGMGRTQPGADEMPIPLLNSHPRRKVALLVEPTPFTHVSGYSNRFKEMLRFLKEGGDEPAVITPDDSPERPSDFLGIPITYVPGFRLIFYKTVQLTMDFGLQAWRRLQAFRPDLIHVATPGFFVLPAIL